MLAEEIVISPNVKPEHQSIFGFSIPGFKVSLIRYWFSQIANVIRSECIIIVQRVLDKSNAESFLGSKKVITNYQIINQSKLSNLKIEHLIITQLKCGHQLHFIN